MAGRPMPESRRMTLADIPPGLQPDPTEGMSRLDLARAGLGAAMSRTSLHVWQGLAKADPERFGPIADRVKEQFPENLNGPLLRNFYGKVGALGMPFQGNPEREKVVAGIAERKGREEGANASQAIAKRFAKTYPEIAGDERFREVAGLMDLEHQKMKDPRDTWQRHEAIGRILSSMKNDKALQAELEIMWPDQIAARALEMDMSNQRNPVQP